MITIAIIDDEPRTRDFLLKLVEEFHPWATPIGQAGSVASALALLGREMPDVILLDVEMRDGTGFDLLGKLPDLRSQVIFITAYNHYAVKAIRASALDYIEKPVNPAELASALIRARDNVLRAGQQATHKIPKRIAVPTRLGLRYINPECISHVVADGSYSVIHLEGDVKPLVVSRMLKEVERSLEPFGFIRPNRSCLVNINAVMEVRKTDGGCLVLQDGLVVLMTKHYKETALKGLAANTRFLT